PARRIDGTGQRVRHGVEVGAHVQAVELHVVAHVHHGHHLRGRYDPNQAGEEAGGADAPGQDRDRHGCTSALALAMAGLRGCVATSLRRCAAPYESASRAATSASTIIATSSAKVVRGFHPSVILALEASPT